MIDLKGILGANYRDDLTVDEIAKLLEKDNSFVGVDEFNALKERHNKASSEAAKYKKELNATKTEEELARQQQNEELQNLLRQNEEMTKQLAIIENEKKFIAMGYDEELANKTSKALAEGDMKSFFKYQETFNESQEKKLQEKILKDTKLPDRTDIDGKPEMTKEKFSKMSLREQAEFEEKYPDVYKEFYSEGE